MGVHVCRDQSTIWGSQFFLSSLLGFWELNWSCQFCSSSGFTHWAVSLVIFFFFFSKLQSVKVLYYNTVLCFTLVLHIKHSEIFTYITLEIDLIMGLKLHPDCSGIVREVSAHVFFLLHSRMWLSQQQRVAGKWSTVSRRSTPQWTWALLPLHN